MATEAPTESVAPFPPPPKYYDAFEPLSNKDFKPPAPPKPVVSVPRAQNAPCLQHSITSSAKENIHKLTETLSGSRQVGPYVVFGTKYDGEFAPKPPTTALEAAGITSEHGESPVQALRQLNRSLPGENDTHETMRMCTSTVVSALAARCALRTTCASLVYIQQYHHHYQQQQHTLALLFFGGLCVRSTICTWLTGVYIFFSSLYSE